MEFANDAHARCYRSMRGFMEQLFGESAHCLHDQPVILVAYGSAVVQVVALPWGDADSVVLVQSWLVTGADLTADLLQYLLEQNRLMRFGAFGIDDDGDISFHYSLFGPALDKDELRAAVLAVATTVDAHDDEIVARWGGVRMAAAG